MIISRVSNPLTGLAGPTKLSSKVERANIILVIILTFLLK